MCMCVHLSSDECVLCASVTQCVTFFQLDKYEKESVRDAAIIDQLKKDIFNLTHSMDGRSSDMSNYVAQVSGIYVFSRI